MARTSMTTAIGITMIVLGVLLILGSFQIRALLPFAGIVLIVLGILMLLKTVPGGVLLGVVSLVVGILLLEGLLNLPREVRDVTDPIFRVIDIVAGIVLIILGVGKLRGA